MQSKPAEPQLLQTRKNPEDAKVLLYRYGQVPGNRNI